MLIVLTEDNYFLSGLEPINSNEWVYSIRGKVIILDDGFNFLYFIDATDLFVDCFSYDFSGEVIPFFLKNVKSSLPRSCSIEKIKSEVDKILTGLYRRSSLTLKEHMVLLSFKNSNYSLERTPWSSVGMNYKAWSSIKSSAYLKLGIKNNAGFIHAIHAICRHKYQVFTLR